jgi:hypothetical protein
MAPPFEQTGGRCGAGLPARGHDAARLTWLLVDGLDGNHGATLARPAEETLKKE